MIQSAEIPVEKFKEDDISKLLVLSLTLVLLVLPEGDDDDSVSVCRLCSAT